MYPTPPAPTLPGQKEAKPALQGVRNKQRKGVQKANAKFEPQAFRDQLVKHLESVPPGDFDAVASKLDALGSQLDYRKYEQELFEILLVGGLLAPGGGYLEDGTPKSSFSVFSSAKEPVEVADIKKIVDVFNKLMRRYKYLQKPFEETALKGILQYANKFSVVDQDKLAVSTALFVANGLASASVLSALKKEHLVKDGSSLTFLTTFFKSYLLTESLDHLATSLRKGGLTDLENFFPPPRNTTMELTNHFKSIGLGGVTEFYLKMKSGAAKEDMAYRLKEFMADDADMDEILAYLEIQHSKAVLPEPEFIALVWNGLLSTFDMNALPEQVVALVLKEIANLTPMLEPFCEKPATEVALINTIQIWAYENPKVMSAFPKILKVLYNQDVLSDQAIMYWHSKGSKLQARALFLKAAEPLVSFLKAQEEEEEEEESSEEE